jgi:hypothetical protein
MGLGDRALQLSGFCARSRYVAAGQRDVVITAVNGWRPAIEGT